MHALERAAAVAALLMTREQAVTAVENKYQGDFLRDLFLRRAGDEQYVAEHADDVRLGPATGRSWSWPPSSTRPTPDERAGLQRRSGGSWQERFSAAWRQVSRDLDRGIPSVDFSSEVVTLLPVAEGDDEPVAGQRRRTPGGHRGRRRQGGGRRPFSVGVSRVGVRRSTSCPRRTPRRAGRWRSGAG